MLRDLFRDEHDIDLDAYVRDKRTVDDYTYLIGIMNGFKDNEDYYKR